MEPVVKPKTKKTPLLPRGDQQLAALGVKAAAYWADPAQKWITLRYVTAVAFGPQATAYEAAVASRVAAGTSRPIEADELLDLDQAIDSTLYRVKNRLIDKYDKKTALAYYPTVGIIRERKSYIIDAERTRRAAALQVLLKGLKAEKIDNGDYGTTFWQPIATRYAELVGHLTDTNGAISKAVAVKDGQREAITQVLSSLAKVLDGNYPDAAEYKAQLRAAGFQRESY